MSLKAKLGDTWKEAKSLHVKVNGEWKDISKLYSKKDGAWFVVFSGGGAIIEFMDYPYAIPVMAGWEYSTDGKNWTTVEDVPLLPYDFSNISVSWDLTYDGSAQYLNGTVYLNGASLIDDSNVGSIEYELTYTGPNSLSGSTTTGTRDYTMNKTEFQAVINGGSFDSNGFGGYKSLASATISSMVVYDTEGNVIQTLADIQKFPEITGKVGDWDFSGATMYCEVGGGPWYVVTNLSGSTPAITRLVVTSRNTGSTGTHTVSHQGESPAAGPGVCLELVNGTGSDQVWHDGNVSVEFYAGDTYLGTKHGMGIDQYATSNGEESVEYPNFTGYVKVKGELSLSEYYNETGERVAESGLRMDGESLSVARSYSTSFVNNSKGYVCGGTSSSKSNVVDVYDSSGTRTTGTSLSVARTGTTSFLNNSKGYVCGGYASSYSNVVDVYDSSGTRTTGTSLSVARADTTSFLNNSKGYVCGGSGSSNSYSVVVDVYDSSGNRSTGNSLSVARSGPVSFVNNSRGYVCGGNDYSSYHSVVDVYDSSGTRTTGTSLSVARTGTTSFLNNSKGYVCGGRNSGQSGENLNVVDVYDSSGNRSTGNSLSVARSGPVSFVNNSKGYVCGGYDSSYSSVVEVYDSSGNRSTGTSLSYGGSNLTSFVNNSRGYVCGGYYNGYRANVDVYYDLYETTYSANIPVTEGSTYELATTVTSTGDWDMSNATGVAAAGNACTVSGITGSTPPVSKIVITVNGTDYEKTVSDNNPNGKYSFAGFPLAGYDADSITLYDASGNIIASTVPFEHNASGTASVSEILTFDSPVSGTINYVSGDLTPSVQITVTDDSGNVIEGAEITIEEYNDWDVSNATITVSGGYLILRDTYGSIPTCRKFTLSQNSTVYATLNPSTGESGGQSGGINGTWNTPSDAPSSSGMTVLILYDSSGNEIARNETVPYTVSTGGYD